MNDYSQHSELPKYISDLADVYWNMKKYDKSKELYQYVAQNSSDIGLAIKGQTWVAGSEIQLGNYTAAEQAIETLKTNYLQSPELPKYISDLADVYRNMKKYDKSKELFQYTIDNSSDASLVLYARVGQVCSEILLGNDTAAEQAISSLMNDYSGQPGLPEAVVGIGERGYYPRAWASSEEGDQQLAKIYFQKLISLYENHVLDKLSNEIIKPEVYMLLGVSYGRLDDYQQSIFYYERCLSEFPNGLYAGNYQFMVGRNYEKMLEAGQISKSEAIPLITNAYEKLLEDHPDCKVAPIAKRWLASH